MIGTTLDKYEVLQKVGEGGMATVYRGRHSTLDRTVAIKILHPHLSSSTRNRTRFKREVQAIERLRHENILEIYDYSGNEVSDCYIVTEFVDGATLSSLLATHGSLPSEVVAQIGIALCHALGYAHEQGVLHRDVKTDNVMLRTDGTVKLMDFGIARFLDDAKVTMTGALIGSPAFMSPEQSKEGKLDQRSDLFALGTVLFYLVTGHLPFTGGNPSLILKNVIEGNRQHVAELAPTMSASLADVIERLMATNPDDRFTTAADAERHLVGCLRETRIEPTAPEWSLAAWINDPAEYNARLDLHLRNVLVAEGRRLLGVGDHLAALRLLNRLLSMDENNAEVLDLVQGLHGEPAPAGTRRTRLVAGAALAVIGVGMLAMFVAARKAPLDIEHIDLDPPHQAPESLGAASALPGAEPVVGPVVGPDPAPIQRPVMPDPPPEPAPAPVAPHHALRPDGGTDRAVQPADPTPDARVAPPAPPAEPAAGVVRLNTGDYLADVYLHGNRLGDTRKELFLPAGTHELELRSKWIVEQTVQVTVASGERRVVPVTLQPKPSRVSFSRAVPGECNVAINGQPVGTAASLGWTWTVVRPDQPIDVSVGCPDGRTGEMHWNNLVNPAQFPDL